MAAWADRIKAWFGGGDAGVPGAVAERARGVAQGSPDAIRVVAPDAGPVVAPFWTHGGGMDQLTDRLRLGSTLLEKYVDYELMDDSDLLSAALDVIADDCTIRDLEEERCVWATGADDVARGVVDELLEKRLLVEDDAWSTIRTMGKYGQSAAEIVAGKGGVVGLNYLPIATMRKVLDHRGQVQGYVQSVTGSFEAVTATAFPKMLADRGKVQGPNRDGIVAFHPWEIVWWQMPSKQVRAPYGVSALDPVRWAWKRLNMLEDAAIVFRLVNGAAHYVLRAEVGTMAPKERATYLQQVKSSWKKRKVTDSSTGQLDFRAAPLASDEVIVVPVMEGKESVGIDVLNGPDYDIIGDLTYFQNKLVSGLGIPRTHLGLEQEATRASLCLSADTRIPLLDGSCPTIEELSKRGEPFHVYSIDEGGGVTIGVGRDARVTRRNAETVVVGLDNGEEIVCTPDHPMMLRTGEYIEASLLREGDSLMPLYRHESTKVGKRKISGYEMVYDPRNNEFIYVHHMVANAFLGKNIEEMFRGGNVIHHKNFNKKNNDPSNLEWMARRDHSKKHREWGAKGEWTEERRKNQSEKMKERMADPSQREEKSRLLSAWNRTEEHREKVRGEKHPRWRDLCVDDISRMAKETRARGIWDFMKKTGVCQSVIYRVLEKEGMSWNDFASKNIDGWTPRGRALHPKNHKVKFVKRGEVQDMYDISVDKYHNFAISQGVFVHNSSLDVQFARSEMRRQRQYLAGLRQIMRLHLALLDIDPDTLDVGLDMTVPSSILEMAQVEAANSRAALAAATADFYDRRTILVDVLGKSEAEAEQILRARREDAVAQGQLDAAVQGQMLGAMQPEGGLAPEGEGAEAAAEQVAQETEAMRKRLDALSEQLDGMGVTARRTEERMRRLPVELRRIMGGRR